ncbi:hypothetical protein DITRI_Ditri03aG0003600 [Diplodiscus trichospermus]
MTDDLQRQKMKKFMGGRRETGSKVFRKKHRRSRKPMFEVLGKATHVYDKKKKDKKKKQIVTTKIDKLGLEEFQFIFSEIRERNRQLKELISEINAVILDKLAIWDAEDK